MQDRKEEPQLGLTIILDSRNDGTTERRQQQKPNLLGGTGSREAAHGGHASGGAVPGADATGINGVGAPGQEESGLRELGGREPKDTLSTSPKRDPTGPSSCLWWHYSWRWPSHWFEFVRTAERVRRRGSQRSGAPSRSSAPQRRMLPPRIRKKKEKTKRHPCQHTTLRKCGSCCLNRLPKGTESGTAADLIGRRARNGPWSTC